MHHNEKGLTLVEVLAVLVLIALVTGIIWTTLTISVKHNKSETTKLQLQQEANAVITKLQEIHRYNNCYMLTIETEQIEVTNCNGGETEFHQVLTNNYTYKAVVGKASTNSWTSVEILKISDIKNLEIKSKESNLEFGAFFVKEKGEGKIFSNVPTTISRYKSIGIEGE